MLSALFSIRHGFQQGWGGGLKALLSLSLVPIISMSRSRVPSTVLAIAQAYGYAPPVSSNNLCKLGVRKEIAREKGKWKSVEKKSHIKIGRMLVKWSLWFSFVTAASRSWFLNRMWLNALVGTIYQKNKKQHHLFATHGEKYQFLLFMKKRQMVIFCVFTSANRAIMKAKLLLSPWVSTSFWTL